MRYGCSRRNLKLHINLNPGQGKGAVMYAADLTEEYVDFLIKATWAIQVRWAGNFLVSYRKH